MASKDKNKERERRKRERRRTKYGQAKLKESRRGMESCIAAVSIFLLLILLLIMAYTTRGQAAAIIGAIGLLTILCACFGIVLGIKGFKERDKSYTSCKVGIGLNIFFVLLFIIIFIRGLI